MPLPPAGSTIGSGTAPLGSMIGSVGGAAPVPVTAPLGSMIGANPIPPRIPGGPERGEFNTGRGDETPIYDHIRTPHDQD